MQIDRHTTATTGSAPGVVLRGELLTMMASLHPDPLEVADALELTAIYETYNECGVFLGYVVRDASGALVAVRDSLAEVEDATRSPGLRGGNPPGAAALRPPSRRTASRYLGRRRSLRPVVVTLLPFAR